VREIFFRPIHLDIINQAAVATAEKVAARLLNGKEEMA